MGAVGHSSAEDARATLDLVRHGSANAESVRQLDDPTHAMVIAMLLGQSFPFVVCIPIASIFTRLARVLRAGLLHRFPRFFPPAALSFLCFILLLFFFYLYVSRSLSPFFMLRFSLLCFRFVFGPVSKSQLYFLARCSYLLPLTPNIAR
jgi:hypothetical protein